MPLFKYLAMPYQELLFTIRRPKRLLRAANPNALRSYFHTRIRSIWLRAARDRPWVRQSSNSTFIRKDFRSYEEYVRLQRSKLEYVDLSTYDIKYREALRSRLQNSALIRQGMTVLCLAARIGTEVKAFLDLGAFAVGIDLNPGENNRYVLHGDFHDLQFAPSSIDVVFTNSLDHAFDIEKLLDEMKKVLKPSGLLIVEAVAETTARKGKPPGGYESFWWTEIEDLISLFEKSWFRLMGRCSFDFPWLGEQLCFEKQDESHLTRSGN